MVIPVPDSGVPAALGYSEASLIPYDTALIRNHYVGLTFIEPQQSIRHFGVKIKLNAVRELIKGKRVMLVDDSVVRGPNQGLGSDGALTVSGTVTLQDWTLLDGGAAAGDPDIDVDDATAFAEGDELLVLSQQGTDAGPVTVDMQ